jgi:hypothetical protein
MAREITGEAFLEKFLHEETDFRGITLVEPDLTQSTLYAHAKDVSERLYADAAYGAGINLTDAKLAGLKAPHICFNGAIFDGARLENVELYGVLLGYASFKGAKIENLDVQWGQFSCNLFENSTIDGIDITGARFFENSLVKTILLKAKGIEEAASIHTSSISDLIVDPSTYAALQKKFPVHAPLVAMDMPSGVTINGVAIPEGSKILNAEYYLNAQSRRDFGL